MDHPDSRVGGGPPRKELQGPRPPPLKVRKESHKIRKPPVAPSQQPQQQPPRQPVIIYTVSPKVIHTNPSDFMTLVQRLTGPDPTTCSSFQPAASYSSVSSSSRIVDRSGAISPAARLASIENTKVSLKGQVEEVMDIKGGGGGGGDAAIERTGFFTGILSPGPGSLPPISPNFFSPFSDTSTMNLYHHQHDLNPVHHVPRSSIESSHVPSPSLNFISPSTMFSPSSLDFLHNLLNN